jgi:hypothetical protein
MKRPLRGKSGDTDTKEVSYETIQQTLKKWVVIYKV